MAPKSRLPFELPTIETNLTPVFWLFVLAATLLGAGHHIDHIIESRGEYLRL